jgi:hypothetical protein
MGVENIEYSANIKDFEAVTVGEDQPFYYFQANPSVQSATVADESKTVTFSFGDGIPKQVADTMQGDVFLFDTKGNIYDKDLNLIQSGVAIEVLENKA